ncbi:unnamed protein product [Musa acuminata var. zebrina]
MANRQPSAEVVGKAFIEQYYYVLQHHPEMVHQFYKESSKLGRPDDRGDVTSVTTIDGIKEKIMATRLGVPEIRKVDSQDSHNGGVLVHVTGRLIREDDVQRGFFQVFFLAPQETGYFVLNDILRYAGDIDDQGSANDREETVPLPIDDVIATAYEVCDSMSNGESWTVQEKEPDNEICDSVNNDESSTVPERESRNEVLDVASDGCRVGTTLVQQMYKRTYAEVMKPKKGGAVKESAAAASKAVPTPTSDTPISTSGAAGNNTSVCIKNIPFGATPAHLEEHFKRFGPIKPGGIQVRTTKCQERPSCYGFVEFEMADSARNAIKASPIIISGRQVYIEQKKIFGSGVNDNRGRFPPGRGDGHLSAGARQHGNRSHFGGRAGNPRNY